MPYQVNCLSNSLVFTLDPDLGVNYQLMIRIETILIANPEEGYSKDTHVAKAESKKRYKILTRGHRSYQKLVLLMVSD